LTATIGYFGLDVASLEVRARLVVNMEPRRIISTLGAESWSFDLKRAISGDERTKDEPGVFNVMYAD
jgi:hypothetical protein